MRLEDFGAAHEDQRRIRLFTRGAKTTAAAPCSAVQRRGQPTGARRGIALIRPIIARSQRGTEVAALFYTLLLRGLELKGYLRQAVMAALATPGTVTLPA